MIIEDESESQPSSEQVEPDELINQSSSCKHQAMEDVTNSLK
jgi:hypothetical protein